ncbi:hypothetical protein V9T40_004949 [Parthenolecanium corni]|uniref:Uncharacterized protein n=1 Tax=Parthenolecanium corni TaxID=536013 RepID=A0AAN9TU21_9HEMI
MQHLLLQLNFFTIRILCQHLLELSVYSLENHHKFDTGINQEDGYTLVQIKRIADSFVLIVLKGLGINHFYADYALDYNDNQIYLRLAPRLVRQLTRLFDVYQWRKFLMNFYTSFSVQCWKPATEESTLVTEQDFTYITRSPALDDDFKHFFNEFIKMFQNNNLQITMEYCYSADAVKIRCLYTKTRLPHSLLGSLITTRRQARNVRKKMKEGFPHPSSPYARIPPSESCSSSSSSLITSISSISPSSISSQELTPLTSQLTALPIPDLPPIAPFVSSIQPNSSAQSTEFAPESQPTQTNPHTSSPTLFNPLSLIDLNDLLPFD